MRSIVIRYSKDVEKQMPQHLATARKYQQRAKDLRKLAEAMGPEEPQEEILALAEEYERMASAELARSTIKDDAS